MKMVSSGLDFARMCRWLGALSVGFALAFALIATAYADYSVPAAHWSYGHASNGGKVVEYNSGLPVSGARSAWNTWTGTSKLTYSTSTSGCGSTLSCTIFVKPSVARPTVNGTTCWGNVSTGSWATAHIDAGPSYRTAACGGSVTNQVFQVMVSNLSFTSAQQNHIARHELGHSLFLNEADANGTVACWSSGGAVYPLMKNDSSSCASFGSNYTASANEISAVISRNGW